MTWSRAAVLLSVLVPVLVDAQREPVLKQIQLPHDYYYREMYLPQVTSGPSSVAWSPDGRDLVFSMQGSLWRQRIDSTVTEQLTDGPGCDYQPDWSPDGRFIVFASYRNDAMDLCLLDVGTGRASPLVANGAVQVEPRWSPDGTRLAFVSSLFEGRWHIYTAPFKDGKVGPIERLTRDNDSGLPRYYYSRFDHYLSPTWSPDGREIVLISNRGRIHGTGGFWRMDARAGAHPREIHYEETTWKARPDWSPDGGRVVYSSYLGRPWHQIWLMTDEGGDVFPLSYGEFDATAPRWSPDGERIAYISNEGGNTSLWVMDVPGGRRRRLEIHERRYRGSVGRLELRIMDGVSGDIIPARVSVTGGDGRGYAPHDAWRHADDSFDRSQRSFEYSYFHSPGISELTAPVGPITVEVTRGLEHRPVRRQLDISADETSMLEVVLEPFADFRSKGWYNGDLHVHMNYGGTYRNTPEVLAFQAEAEDLDFVENLIVNKEQRIPDIAYFTGSPEPAAAEEPLIVHDQEFHTSIWGHLGVLGLREHLLLPDYAGYVNTAAASLFPHNAAVVDLARRQGGIVGYVHPFVAEPDPSDPAQTITGELPVDAALGRVDYLEVVGFSDHLATAKVWYRLLNCGFRIPAGAGTDAMANFASLRGPVGVNRVFVKTGRRPDQADWLGAIRHGRTFATNGPLLELTLDGKEAGDEVHLPSGRHEVTARGLLQSMVPIEHLEIVGNGRVVATLAVSGERTSANFDETLIIEKSGWYTLRAWSELPRHPVLDAYPFATTSPIYVTVGDEPVRSRTDAEYFIAWVGRLEAYAREHEGWNTAQEKEAVLDSLRQARAVFEQRASAGTSRPP